MTSRRLAMLYGGAFLGVSLGSTLMTLGPGLGVDTLRPGAVIGSRDSDTVLGSDGLPTLLCFLSLTCPHCRDWSREVLPVLTEGPIKAGTMRVVLREHPKDRPSLLGAVLLRLQHPAGRIAMRARMSDKGVENALEQAEGGGLGEEIRRGLLQHQELSASVFADMKADQASFGIRGTPTFAGGHSLLLGNRSAQDLMRIIGV